MTFLPALILGFAGSVHCLGMCGPIAMAIPVGSGSMSVRSGNYLIYHFGRITAYAILGFLFGVLGFGLDLAGVQQGLSLGVGLFMLGFIWLPKVKLFSGLHSGMARIQSKTTSMMAKYLKSNRPAALLGLGFFNGFLPCGFVYLALAGALITYNPFGGSLFMAVFGLGTVPALLVLALTGNKLGQTFKLRFQSFAPYLVTAIALLFILRGLGLGIPYLSPDPGFVVESTEACH